MNSWEIICKNALILVDNFPDIYKSRIKFELSEIEKQGAISFWQQSIENNKKFDKNPNKLLLPFLFGLVDEDPLKNSTDIIVSSKVADVKKYVDEHGDLPVGIIKDADMPDIDIDCLPEARDAIKEFALNRYKIDDGDEEYGPVCSVGTWQTYKFKSAIIAVSRALNAAELYEVHTLTKSLPDEVDELKEGGFSVCKGVIHDADTGKDKECAFVHDKVSCPQCGSIDTESPTFGKVLAENDALVEFNNKYPAVVEAAKNLVGRISNMGMHSGAVIISDRNLFGAIPMAKNGSKGFWLSMWTEGRNTQLSKFGYFKYDFLGLKTLEYIHDCCKLIEKNRGISFGENALGLEDIDPDKGVAGHYYDGEGNKKYIELNDKDAIALANKQATDSIFQFDTDLAKCCRFDSNIDTDMGLVEIQHLDVGKHAIKFLSGDGTIQYTKNYVVQEAGQKDIIEIVLSDGSVLYLTSDHRVLTHRGYIKVSDLNEDDEIKEASDYNN
jgi:hypothetical protein